MHRGTDSTYTAPSLTTHSELTLRAGEQTVLGLSNVPLDEALKVWVAMPKK